MYLDHHGKVSDKWSLYLREYDRIFGPYRTQKVSLLEIGIQNGGSMEIWPRYFPAAEKFIGCDIDPECARLRYDDPRVVVVTADANLDQTEHYIIAQASAFDIIIDDGSHRSSDIVKSFVRYFPYLKQGGVFVAEDLHCSYWSEFEGGLVDPTSSIRFFQLLADIVNYEHWGIARARADLLAMFEQQYQVRFDEALLSQIHSIEFINSICVIHKAPVQDNVLGERLIVGEEELVASNVKEYHGSHATALDQTHNVLSYLPPSTPEMRPAMTQQMALQRTAHLDAVGYLQQMVVLRTATEQAQRYAEEVEFARQALARQLAQEQQRLADNEAQAGILRAQLAASHGQSAALQEQLRQLQLASDDTHAQLIEAQAQLSDTRIQFGDARLVAALELQQALAEREKQLAAANQALAEQNIHVGNLEYQRNFLNGEVSRLTQEASSFGARLGRRITGLRGKLAPMQSRRGKLVTLGVRFATKVAVAGPKEASRIALMRLRSMGTAKTARYQHASDGAPGEQGNAPRAKTDHPQLEAWIAEHEPDQDALQAQALEAAGFGYRPLISVIIPIYKVPRDVLVETLSCLREQTYGNWEGCIVWADSPDLEGWQWLQDYVRDEPRFKIEYLQENEGISGNSNAALRLAEGEYAALLDHDDTLTPWAFYEVAKLLQTAPETDFIYSDKDSMSADGHVRLNALFKPQWSPEMMHSVNYLTHLNVMRTQLIRDIGGWHKETDGAQDWDIFFRVIEQARHVARIPSILYHWRILPTSTATGLAAKPYAALGQLRVQQNYFRRKGLSATAMPTRDGLFHIHWPSKTCVNEAVIYQSGTAEQLLAALNVLRCNHLAQLAKIHVLYRTADAGQIGKACQGWDGRFVLTAVDAPDWRQALHVFDDIAEEQVVVLLDGRACDYSEGFLTELTGWVEQHGEIAWTSAIALNPDNTVYEAGRVVSADYGSAPMFHGSALYSFGWFGGPLWYRNSRAASPYAMAMRVGHMRSALATVNDAVLPADGFAQFCLALTATGQRRGLVNPFAKVFFKQAPETQWPNDGVPYHDDPYFNPAFDQVSPLRLHS